MLRAGAGSRVTDKGESMCFFSSFFCIWGEGVGSLFEGGVGFFVVVVASLEVVAKL